VFKYSKVVQFPVVLNTHLGDFLFASRLFEKTQSKFKAHLYIKNHNILAFLLATLAVRLGLCKNHQVKKAKRLFFYNSILWFHSPQFHRRKVIPKTPPYRN